MMGEPLQMWGEWHVGWWRAGTVPQYTFSTVKVLHEVLHGSITFRGQLLNEIRV
jgi:hypothetical protein